MKKLIAAIVIIFVAITTISCVAISKKSTASQGELEKTLTVYTTESNAKMEYIANAFKKATGITVNYKLVSNLNTAVESAKNAGENVDVVYGGNQIQFANMTNENLLAKTPVTFSNEIADTYKNAQGYWYGTSLNPVVMYYNSSYMLPKDVPTEWYQLAEPQYYNRIVLPSTESAITQTLIGTMAYKYSKSQVNSEFDTFLQGLRNNVLAYSDNQDNVMNEMKTNKAAAISVGTLSEVNAAISQGVPFKVINATDGSPIMMNGVGVLKDSKNLNSAQLFVEFVAGPNMQVQLAEKFGAIPTISSILQYCPSWMSNTNTLNIAQLDWATITSSINTVMDKFNSLVKAPKVAKLKLDAPVITDALIPSQQKNVKKPETKEEKTQAAAKAKATAAKVVAEQKAKQTAQQQTQAAKSALQGLQSLGETSM